MFKHKYLILFLITLLFLIPLWEPFHGHEGNKKEETCSACQWAQVFSSTLVIAFFILKFAYFFQKIFRSRKIPHIITIPHLNLIRGPPVTSVTL